MGTVSFLPVSFWLSDCCKVVLSSGLITRHIFLNEWNWDQPQNCKEYGQGCLPATPQSEVTSRCKRKLPAVEQQVELNWKYWIGIRDTFQTSFLAGLLNHWQRYLYQSQLYHKMPENPLQMSSYTRQIVTASHLNTWYFLLLTQIFSVIQKKLFTLSTSSSYPIK